MKKCKLLLLLFSFFLLFFSQSLKLIAQTQMSTGLKGGFNFSKWGMTQPVNGTIERIAGFTASVPIEFQFTHLYGLQSELCFIQKGNRFDSYDNISSSIISLNYFEIPILAKLTLGKKMKLTINAGPFFGYAISGKVINISKYYPQEEIGIDFVRDEINRMDAGIIMGAGIKMPVNVSFVTIDLRYAYGLVDISNENPNSVKVNNKGFNIMVGILLPISKKKNDTIQETKK